MFFDTSFRFVGVVQNNNKETISYKWYIIENDQLRDYYSEANIRHDFLTEIDWTPFSTLMQELI